MSTEAEGRAPGLPAVLGGAPKFSEMLPIVRPEIPSREALSADFDEVFSSRMLTNHRFVERFEQAVSERLDVRHALCVSSCTSGMMLVLRALGVEGGEVVVPSYTFMASVLAIVWAGAKPVFADIDADTLTVDPDSVREAIGPQTKAVMGVHNFGVPAPVDELDAIGEEHDLPVVYDSAHALGTSYRGRAAGDFGTAEVFSLSPTKLVTSAEGGIVTTNDDELAQTIRIGRNYGNPGDYNCLYPGLSARMSEVHAVLGHHSLMMLDAAVERRNALAERYRAGLCGVPGVSFQMVPDGAVSSFKDFTILVDGEAFGLNRDLLSRALAADYIDTRKYYSPPCHRMTAFEAARRTALPVTEAVSGKCLSLPIWSGMEKGTVEGVCGAVVVIHDQAGRVKEALAKPDGEAEGAV